MPNKTEKYKKDTLALLEQIKTEDYAKMIFNYIKYLLEKEPVKKLVKCGEDATEVSE